MQDGVGQADILLKWQITVFQCDLLKLYEQQLNTDPLLDTVRVKCGDSKISKTAMFKLVLCYTNCLRP